MLNIVWRNMKWRFQNPISIGITLLQPVLWLVLYGSVAGQTMQNKEISNYTAFILPGVLVLVSFAACSSSGMMNYIMKSTGSFYRIWISPVRRSSIVLGQMLEAVLLSFLEAAIVFGIGAFFSAPIEFGFFGGAVIAFLLFITSFFMSGISYIISLCLPNEVVYEMAMNVVVLLLFFLSTALFPLEALSGGVKAAVYGNPFTHVINALRSVILGETFCFEKIFPVIILFTILCGAVFFLAVKMLKNEME